jgi:MFS family permease
MQIKNIVTIYLAGLLQGLTLVAFPAASSIFTSPEYFDLSSERYGALFIPQAICSILASLICSKFSKALFIGLFANFISMTLLASANSYWVLLLSTGMLGIGFGFTVPTINTFAAKFFPHKTDTAILVLNALLGLGTALAPVLVALFIGYSVWWGLPTALALLTFVLFLFGCFLPWESKNRVLKNRSIPSQLWLFALFALVYGMIETIHGNWATVYMLAHNATQAEASLALTCFWFMVTLGRIFFTPFSGKLVFRCLPWVALISFILIAMIPKQAPVLGIVVFGLAGLSCSALLPLTISFGTKVLPKAAGILIACYLLGYGISAFGVGLAKELFSLQTIFGACAVLALLLGGLSFKLTKS